MRSSIARRSARRSRRRAGALRDGRPPRAPRRAHPGRRRSGRRQDDAHVAAVERRLRDRGRRAFRPRPRTGRSPGRAHCGSRREASPFAPKLAAAIAASPRIRSRTARRSTPSVRRSPAGRGGSPPGEVESVVFLEANHGGLSRIKPIGAQEALRRLLRETTLPQTASVPRRRGLRGMLVEGAPLRAAARRSRSRAVATAAYCPMSPFDVVRGLTRALRARRDKIDRCLRRCATPRARASKQRARKRWRARGDCGPCRSMSNEVAHAESIGRWRRSTRPSARRCAS